MLFLALRTDKPEAELYLYSGETRLDQEVWQAHRRLAETLHTKISEILKRNNNTLQDIRGIACFQGPGSFTGLRIGLTVANALAYSLGVPVVACQGEDWATAAVSELSAGSDNTLALPFYGADVHITAPKK